MERVMRSIDALQLSDRKQVVTPVEWENGDQVIIPPSASAKDYDGKVKIQELPSGKQYLRWTTAT